MSTESHPNPHAARVILWDGPPGNPQEPKILHSLKVSPQPEVEPDAEDRAIRETLAFDGFPIKINPDGSIRDTVEFFPPIQIPE